ncbi:hypothetical protein J4229_01575 [Candidatus Pacearchaeota archaeon]|nr:hypothetical protein [Candidatus Pacearchaeota archaeon]
MNENKESKITTIKLTRATKDRLDNLREYKRETYEEIIEKMLEILNFCKINPLRARAKLLKIDNRHKETFSR